MMTHLTPDFLRILGIFSVLYLKMWGLFFEERLVHSLVLLSQILLFFFSVSQACSYHNTGRNEKHLHTTMPRRSDIVFTSRTPHLVPPFPPGVGAGTGKLSTWEAATGFYATRLDWVYTLNSTFVAEAHRHNLSSVGLAMNPQIPDANGTTYQTGRVLNVHGEPLVAPWMRAWPTQHPYGCVNNPVYKTLAFARAKLLVVLGANAVQHDDPTSNAEAVSWSNGDPEQSGCYCSVCMKGYTEALVSSDVLINATQRHQFNITSSFNYKDYLLRDLNHSKSKRSASSNSPWLDMNSSSSSSSNNNNKAHDSAMATKSHILREMFVEYQRNATKNYLSELRKSIDPAIPLTCNNGGQWDDIYDSFDFGMGELSIEDANPGGLRDIFVRNVPDGKMQIMTMPKSKNLTVDASGEFVRLIRRSIAQSYALGSNMFVPWDIYLPTPRAARYFGAPSQFQDIFSFVREHASLLDSMGTAPFDRISTDGFRSVGTGTKGDGVRFRLPTDNPPSPGNILDGHRTQGACAWECRRRATSSDYIGTDDCAGFFSSVPNGGRGTCVLLRVLKVVRGTAMVGASWAVRAALVNDTMPLHGVSTNLTYVDAVLRGMDREYCSSGRSNNSSSNSRRKSNGSGAVEWAVHLVNWNSRGGRVVDAGGIADVSWEMVEVKLENAAVCRPNADGVGRVMMASLIVPGASNPQVLWNGPPSEGNNTNIVVMMSALQPWGIITVVCE